MPSAVAARPTVPGCASQSSGAPIVASPSMPPYVSQMIGPNRSNMACFAGIGHGADPWSTRFIDETS